MLKNLLADLPGELPEELFETLLQTPSVRIERIVSTGQASPPGFWYDQEEHEWILLLRGSALLRFDDEAAPVALQPGDCLNIPAHRRHRVEETSSDQPTVWLAIFYRDG